MNDHQDQTKPAGGASELSGLVSHKCSTCVQEFATCLASKVVFGIDIDKTLRGAAADAVIECNGYVANDKLGAGAEVSYLASEQRPRDGGPRFRVSDGGRMISDEDFIFDATIRVGGDFGDDAIRTRYAQWVCDSLNEADKTLPRESNTAARISDAQRGASAENGGRRKPAGVNRLEALVGRKFLKSCAI